MVADLRKASKGQTCKVRVIGVCTFNNEETVGAHLNGAGMALKNHDLFIADACSACHAWLDGGYVKTVTRQQRDHVHFEAIIRTQVDRIERGVITL